MRQTRFHTLAILILAGLVGFFGGYVNEALARDHGARTHSHHRGGDYRIAPHHGHGGRSGLSRGRDFSEQGRGGAAFRRDGFPARSGYRDERRRPFGYQGGGRSWRQEHSDRRHGFGRGDRGWRERQDRFDRHDRRREGHWRERERRGRDRFDIPRRRYDRQFGTEIAPVDRSWNSSSRVVDDDRVVYLGSGPFDGDAAFATQGLYPSGAKWIDVSADRLDRRALGRDGIDIAYAGGSKVIRLGPDFSARNRQRSRNLQPWSSAWLRHCAASYRSFDPALGTYVAGSGRVRFCNP